VSAYIVFHYNIKDRSRIDELGPLSLPIVEQFDGEICIASPVKNLEQSPYSHMVVYKFPSMEAATGYCESPAYRELSILRKQLVEGIAVLVPGFNQSDSM